ncbi:MAG: T9SS type A sorting domain-containing protein [Saprospiraceae bacterium]|nr:T9SS type A sorting domain-containing protein [Saprospiraceae bacterium]
MKFIYCLGISCVFMQNITPQCFTCKDAPSGTIFCDDFEDNTPLNQKYFEINNNNGDFIRMDKVGRDMSYGMRVKWQAGEVGAGGLSKSFGKTPDSYIGKNASHPNENFDEIYWRMDVKAQEGWTGGGPAKLSRALCLANSNWAEGMMAHLWSGGTNDHYLGMDPASGIGTDGKLKATKYNDFANLRWLGFKSGNIDMFSTANSGRWFCVVGHVKLNTPGLKDGVFEFWINDTLQASSTNLDWHSTWNNDPNNMHINAIFFENYWNAGSPVEQERYFDNIVISTEPILCSCTVTGIKNSTFTEEVHVSPNPVKDVVSIDIPENLLPLNVHIYDLNSRLILETELVDSKDIIDVSEFKPGVYILKTLSMKPVKLIVTRGYL